MGDILKPLTVEQPLDPPELIDYKAQSSRRDSMQRHTPRAQWNLEVRQAERAEIEAEEEEERLNLWRQQSEDDEKEWAIAQSEEQNTM